MINKKNEYKEKKITHLDRTLLINWINKFIVERARFNDTFRVVRGLGDSTLPWSPYTLLGSRGGCGTGSWMGRGYVTGVGRCAETFYTDAVLCTIIIC